MNFRTTAFLLFLLILVGGYFAIVEWGKPGDTPEDSSAADRNAGELLIKDPILPEDVQALTLERDGEVAVIEHTSATEWVQTEPVRFAMLDYLVKQLPEDLAQLRYVEKSKPGTDKMASLDKIGLQPPRAVLHLKPKPSAGKDKDKKSGAAGSGANEGMAIKFGDKILGGRGYVMIEGDPYVYQVSDELHKKVLDQKVRDYRKKQLASVNEGQAERVSVTREDGVLSAVKRDGQWAFAEPQSGRAGRDKIGGVVSSIGATRIEEFVADKPKDLSLYGLDKPTTIIQVLAATPQPVSVDSKGETPAATAPASRLYTLTIGAPESLERKRYFATWSESDPAASASPAPGIPGNVVFTINETDVAKFIKKPNDLRDPKITVLTTGDVRELTVDRQGAEAIRLQHGAEGWKFADAAPSSPAPPYPADKDEAAALLATIVNAEAADYQPMAKPEGEPAAVVTLTAMARPEPETIKIYPVPAEIAATAPAGTQPAPKATAAKPKQRLVLRNNESTGYLVPAEKLDPLFVPVIALRERSVIDLPTARLNDVTITQHDGTVFHFTREVPSTQPAETTVSTQPASKPAEASPWKLEGQGTYEAAAFTDALKRILPLKAQKWQAEPASIGAKSVDLTLATAEGIRHQVRVDPQTRQASAAGIDAGFTVSQTLVDDLTAEYRHRTVLNFAAMQIKDVQVQRGETTVVMHKDGMKYVDASAQQLDDAAAAGIFDTLAGLRARRFVSKPALKPESAVVTLTVKLADDKQETLTIYRPEGQEPIAQHGEQWFTLDPKAFEKLRAVPGPKKPAAPGELNAE